MLTIKAEVKKDGLRADQTYNVKIRFTLNRQVKRLSTSLFVSKEEITKSFHFKEGTAVKVKIDELVAYYRKKCLLLDIDQTGMSVSQVIDTLEADEARSQQIDFFQFADNWISQASIKGADNYRTAINSLKRYVGKDTLDINMITHNFIEGYKNNLQHIYDEKVKKLTLEHKRVTSNRALSLYLMSIKHLFDEAKRKYNQPDRNIIVIPGNPFEGIKIPKQEATRKRALSKNHILEIANLPYLNRQKGYRGTCLFDLAKDCFMLSFGLIGMNSADIYNATCLEDGYIIYNRKKTKDRRQDCALMKVEIPAHLFKIIEKYRDHTGKRIFNFYKFYSDEKGFNKAINRGLKQIGELLEIEDLEFYAARHSWATIAMNKAGVDKYTVHSALNHIDESMKVTDIYIERDFVAENNANNKVQKYVFGNV